MGSMGLGPSAILFPDLDHHDHTRPTRAPRQTGEALHRDQVGKIPLVRTAHPTREHA